MLAENQTRIIAVNVIGNELGAPLEWAHNPIIIALCVPEFPPAHPSSEQIETPNRG